MVLTCENFIDGKHFYPNLTLFMSMFQETTIFLQTISREKQNILTMTTPDKIKELEDTIIDFNEYLETVAAGLENLEIGVKAIVENIKVEIEELSKGTEDVISGMKHDVEQGRIVVAQMLKTLSTTKSSLSTIPTEYTAKPTTSQTTEPSSSTPFLEKEKEMLELKAKDSNF